MLTIDEQPIGPLTAADLRPYQNWHDTVMMPAGCDQQGRYATRPMPAEACTDIGAEDNGPPVTRAGLFLVLLPWVLAVAGWAAFLFFKR